MAVSLTLPIAAAVGAAGLKMAGDLFEMLSKTDDMERRPRIRKTLTNTKVVLGCIAAVLAFMGALCLVFEGEALAWAIGLTPTAILVITIGVYIFTGREPEVAIDTAGTAASDTAAQS